MKTNRSFLTRYAWLSIAAALATITLKTIAYNLSNSVGFFSDAVESLVNLAVAILALVILAIAARPADEEHAYGHSKAEYFSSGVEGALILIAALSIAYAGFQRLLAPQALEQVGLGLAVSVVASVINLIVALVLVRASKEHESITLEANGQHLLSDVWRG
jgi:cation diffusion facilitator family transporter